MLYVSIRNAARLCRFNELREIKECCTMDASKDDGWKSPIQFVIFAAEDMTSSDHPREKWLEQ